MRYPLFLLLFAVFALPVNAQSPSACEAPKPVCAARGGVYMISSFDPFASAVRIGPKTLVTNRHVIADAKTVKVKLKDGTEIIARIVPSSYQGDLALLHVDGLKPGPVFTLAKSDYKGQFYTVAGDVSRRIIRTYPPGRVVSAPAEDHPFARLHHSAYSQPGNSGGALVNAKGLLVAIIASGGEGRFDAIPAIEIAKLKALSGPKSISRAHDLGQALRVCVERLEGLPRNLRGLSRRAISALYDDCLASANRPLFDRAAQALTKAGAFDLARDLSNKAVKRDPNAVASRLTLVITMMFARDYKAALPHVRKLIKLAPKDSSVQRFAVQIGKWGGDMVLAKQGLALVRRYNPAQAKAAERFLNANIPPPPRRRRR